MKCMREFFLIDGAVDIKLMRNQIRNKFEIVIQHLAYVNSLTELVDQYFFQ